MTLAEQFSLLLSRDRDGCDGRAGWPWRAGWRRLARGWAFSVRRAELAAQVADSIVQGGVVALPLAADVLDRAQL